MEQILLELTDEEILHLDLGDKIINRYFSLKFIDDNYERFPWEWNVLARRTDLTLDFVNRRLGNPPESRKSKAAIDSFKFLRKVAHKPMFSITEFKSLLYLIQESGRRKELKKQWYVRSPFLSMEIIRKKYYTYTDEDWVIISYKYRNLEELITNFPRKVVWKMIVENSNVTEKVILQSLHHISYRPIYVSSYNLSVEFIRTYGGTLYFTLLGYNEHLRLLDHLTLTIPGQKMDILGLLIDNPNTTMEYILLNGTKYEMEQNIIPVETLELYNIEPKSFNRIMTGAEIRRYWKQMIYNFFLGCAKLKPPEM